MTAMMTGTATLEKKMANIKIILEKLTRESAEKGAHIKFQEEKIAKLTKKLEKQSAQSCLKDSESEDFGKVQSTLRLQTMRSNQRKALRLKILSPLDQ